MKACDEYPADRSLRYHLRDMTSAAILAGGRANRCGGRDKGSLLVEGRSILARQLDELSQLTSDILIVGADRVPTSSLLNLAAVRPVQDRVPGQGPLGGLEAALTAARHDVVVVVACDMPFVTAKLLAHLLSCVGDVDAVVPRTERGYHPLCAVYTRRCRDAIQRRLASGQLAVRGLFEDVQVRFVDASEIARFGDPCRLLANVNTLADHEALQTSQRYEV
jgi:molybdopterin-guanine dinucleotide biosynthesis protein A